MAPPPRITKEDGDEDSLFLFFLALSSDTSCFLGGTAGHKSPFPFPLPPCGGGGFVHQGSICTGRKQLLKPYLTLFRHPPLSPLPPSLVALLRRRRGGILFAPLPSSSKGISVPSSLPPPMARTAAKKEEEEDGLSTTTKSFPPFLAFLHVSPPPTGLVSCGLKVGKRDGASFSFAHYRCFVWEMHC